MALDRKTSCRVSFYDYEQEQIQSWSITGSARLALLVNTISHEKNKIETNKDEFQSSLDYLIYDLKKFLNTPYTPEENA